MTSPAAVPPADDRTRSDGSGHPPVHVVAERLKERVYAQLTVVAVTIGLALGGSGSPGAAASAVAATAVGLWLATLAADQQAHAAVYGHLALGRRMGSGWIAALLAGVVNLVIGALVVGVKLLAGH